MDNLRLDWNNMGNDFDFVKYFSNFVAGQQKPSKEEMINRYIRGTITKQQLDEFMKGCKGVELR